MTAEVELLPLPEPRNDDGSFRDWQLVMFATANVEANTEALRAEVATWKNFARGNKELLQESVYRAERLAEALRGLRWLMLEQVRWESCDCGCPQQRKPDGPHSVTWLRAAQRVEIAIRKAEEKGDV